MRARPQLAATPGRLRLRGRQRPKPPPGVGGGVCGRTPAAPGGLGGPRLPSFLSSRFPCGGRKERRRREENTRRGGTVTAARAGVAEFCACLPSAPLDRQGPSGSSLRESFWVNCRRCPEKEVHAVLLKAALIKLCSYCYPLSSHGALARRGRGPEYSTNLENMWETPSLLDFVEF